LLWKRKLARLERIDFPKIDGDDTIRKPVPSWSWMAYAGPIEYMNLNADWDEGKHDITSPWKYDKSGGGNDAALELRGLVREMAHLPPGAQVFIDDPNQTVHGSLKCVVVGSSKMSHQGGSQKYYVLIVTPLNAEESNIYERAGVAFLRKHQIAWEIPAVEARIR
jgi:hypothetical protein